MSPIRVIANETTPEEGVGDFAAFQALSATNIRCTTSTPTTGPETSPTPSPNSSKYPHEVGHRGYVCLPANVALKVCQNIVQYHRTGTYPPQHTVCLQWPPARLIARLSSCSSQIMKLHFPSTFEVKHLMKHAIKQYNSGVLTPNDPGAAEILQGGQLLQQLERATIIAATFPPVSCALCSSVPAPHNILNSKPSVFPLTSSSVVIPRAARDNNPH